MRISDWSSDVCSSDLGVSGTVVEVRVFNRHGIDKDERAIAIEREEIERLKQDADDERSILNRATFSSLKELLVGQTTSAVQKGMKKGEVLTEQELVDLDRSDWWKLAVVEDREKNALEAIKAQYEEAINRIKTKNEATVDK